MCISNALPTARFWTLTWSMPEAALERMYTVAPEKPDRRKRMKHTSSSEVLTAIHNDA